MHHGLAARQQRVEPEQLLGPPSPRCCKDRASAWIFRDTGDERRLSQPYYHNILTYVLYALSWMWRTVRLGGASRGGLANDRGRCDRSLRESILGAAWRRNMSRRWRRTLAALELLCWSRRWPQRRLPVSWSVNSRRQVPRLRSRSSATRAFPGMRPPRPNCRLRNSELARSRMDTQSPRF